MQSRSSSIAMAGNGQSNSLSQGAVLISGSGIITIEGSRFRYGVGLILTFQPGVTGNATVLVTGDKVDQNAPVNWNSHDVLAGLTGSANSNLSYPVTALALLISNFSNSGATPPAGYSAAGIVLSAVQVTG